MITTNLGRHMRWNDRRPHRFKAARELGLEQVPVLVARRHTHKQARVYRIAVIIPSARARSGFQPVAYRSFVMQVANYDHGTLGFKSKELAKLIG